jgi:hypothetical protein
MSVQKADEDFAETIARLQRKHPRTVKSSSSKTSTKTTLKRKAAATPIPVAESTLSFTERLQNSRLKTNSLSVKSTSFVTSKQKQQQPQTIISPEDLICQEDLKLRYRM